MLICAVVKYEDLMSDFENSMQKIGLFFGYKTVSFSNITEKVGYSPIQNNPKSIIYALYNKIILPIVFKLYRFAKNLNS